MGYRSPRRDARQRAIVHLVLVATAVLVLLVGAPRRGVAHGDRRHAETRIETVAPAPLDVAEPEPAEPGHVHDVVDAAPAEPIHPYPPEGIPRPLAWLGKFHPAAAHFPIALLSVAALAELVQLRRRREPFHQAVRFCVWCGAIAGLAAAPLGWFFAGLRLVDEEWVMTAHRWAGTGTALWASVVLVLCERSYRAGASRPAFQLALLIGAGAVAATGFLGGALVYGLDHYAW